MRSKKTLVFCTAKSKAKFSENPWKAQFLVTKKNVFACGRKARGHIRKNTHGRVDKTLEFLLNPSENDAVISVNVKLIRIQKKEGGKNSQLPIYQVEPAWCNLYVPRLKECGWVVCVSASVQFRAVTYLSCSHYSHINSQQLRHVQCFSSNNIIPKRKPQKQQLAAAQYGIETRNANI